MLKIADKFIAGVLMPGVLLVLLMAIPYLDYNPSRRGKDRKVAIVAGIVAGAVMIILSWMGTPEYAVEGAPAVEIVQDMMPEEGSGVSREIGYQHLPVGVWRTDEEYDVHDHEFNELLHEYHEAVDYYRRQDPDFNAPVGQVTITQVQAGLKKLKWEIFWFDAQGEEGKYDKSFWLHEDSIYWEQYAWKHLFLDYVSDGWKSLSGALVGE
jgi:hypothetical protein